jgi:2,4-dienoyl-CoA reductase (NADPH2)
LRTWCPWRAPSWPTPNLCIKAAEGRADEINTCIGCNQACLDHTFGKQDHASCLVNPRACHRDRADVITQCRQTEEASRWSALDRRAELCLLTAAERGHHGGACLIPPPKLAASSTSPSKIPGKEEFYETLRYYDRQLELRGVKLSLNSAV